MSHEIAFVGDIHGNLTALIGMGELLLSLNVRHTVFLGDYINKGDHSRQVIECLMDLEESGRATILMGNHESALIAALETGDISAFLKMGGAMTIRSYVGGRVGPDVLSEFRAALPSAHVEFIRRMPERFETDELDARHRPHEALDRFQISAHVPVGMLPLIRSSSAQLDTGCGRNIDGRLTAFLWPSRNFVQVDSTGTVVAS
jgi:serine/threonine protein phosphatase 1